MEFKPEKLSTDEVSEEVLDEPDKEPNPERGKEISIDNKTLVLIVGLPGSGKSTFATKHFPLESIVSTDLLRQEISNNPGNQIVSGRAFEIAKKIVSSRLEAGKIAVVDAQNLTEDTRMQFYIAAEMNDAKVTAIFLDVDPHKSIERDVGRGKKVGASYIKGRRGVYAVAKRSLEKSKYVDELYVIDVDEAEDLRITLPEEYRGSVEADRELSKEAEAAKVFIAGAETGFLKREVKDSVEQMPIKAGAVLFVQGLESPERQAFIKDNFLPHQVIDVTSTAKRLAVDINDEAVLDTIKSILYNRIYLNLTTCVSYPPDLSFSEDIKGIVKKAEEKRGIEITSPEIRVDDTDKPSEIIDLENNMTGSVSINISDLRRYQVDIRRDTPDDTPLFIVGDVHGAYTAMREIASRIRQENLEQDELNEPRRQIIFVGDMADRGPSSSETVIYITSLVRQGRAILVKGNHDENLLRGLKGEEIKSSDTRMTVEDLKKRLKPESLQKIINVLENAPYYAEWKNLVVTHASLPRIPRKDEVLKKDDAKTEKHVMTHGARSGKYLGNRAEVWKLHNTVAKDPEVLVVGGHTHEEEPVMNMVSGTTILDGSIELKGKLWGMYYPELELASAEEPTLVNLYKIMESGVMPEGKDLLTFIEYLEIQGLVEIKRGEDEYKNLTLVTYSGYTELTDAWEKYPILRNFRGLIVDAEGNIVARPFEKTHKAGDEIPLDKLNIKPDKVFEKANGSLGIVYFWNGKWQVATKFSFENEDYTKPSREMLSKMSTDVLDPQFTYLFEIILPNDSHMVDYGGKRDLILLNAINAKTGETKNWQEVSDMASKLGARTAEDMTERFKGMTVAQIYEYAQQEGNLKNLEGLMAQYTDSNGKKIMVKVKTREYDDKKFVRDRLDWEDIIEAFDKETMEIPPEKLEALLSYNFDNNFARAALEARIAWIQEEYRKIAGEVREFIFQPLGEAESVYNDSISQGEDKKKAVDKALRAAVPKLVELLKKGSDKFNQNEMNSLMGFLRDIISGGEKPEVRLAAYAINKIQVRIGEEKKKKGKNSFWVVPA